MNKNNDELYTSQNIRAGIIHERIIAGWPLTGHDLVGAPETYIVLDSRSETSNYQFGLLGACVEAKNLSAFRSLLQAGLRAGRGEFSDVLQKVFAPYPRHVAKNVPAADRERVSLMLDSLPVEWAHTVEEHLPGRIQSWFERSYAFHRQGVKGVEKLEACGAKMNPRMINNVIFAAVSTSHSDKEMTETYGPIIHRYFEKGGEAPTADNIAGGKIWTTEIVRCPMRVRPVLARFAKMGIDKIILPVLALLEATAGGKTPRTMKARVEAPAIARGNEGRSL